MPYTRNMWFLKSRFVKKQTKKQPKKPPSAINHDYQDWKIYQQTRFLCKQHWRFSCRVLPILTDQKQKIHHNEVTLTLYDTRLHQIYKTSTTVLKAALVSLGGSLFTHWCDNVELVHTQKNPQVIQPNVLHGGLY